MTWNIMGNPYSSVDFVGWIFRKTNISYPWYAHALIIYNIFYKFYYLAQKCIFSLENHERKMIKTNTGLGAEFLLDLLQMKVKL